MCLLCPVVGGRVCKSAFVLYGEALPQIPSVSVARRGLEGVCVSEDRRGRVVVAIRGRTEALRPGRDPPSYVAHGVCANQADGFAKEAMEVGLEPSSPARANLLGPSTHPRPPAWVRHGVTHVLALDRGGAGPTWALVVSG